MTSGPFYLTSLPLYLCHQTHPFDDIRATICMSSHPVYLWHHILHIYDIISTKYDITTLLLMTQHLAYVWHHLHCRWKCTHSITPNHSIYDDKSTSGMKTHPLYQTSHPLYLCLQAISTDISPTFLWHHIHFCVTSYELYITSHPILMSSHYCTYDITTSIY